MTMCRREFRAIAEALRSERPCDLGAYPFADPDTRSRYDQWGTTCLAVMAVCRESNPRFDRGKFAEACGIGQ
jgi:hypothetical protein